MSRVAFAFLAYSVLLSIAFLPGASLHSWAQQSRQPTETEIVAFGQWEHLQNLAIEQYKAGNKDEGLKLAIQSLEIAEEEFPNPSPALLVSTGLVGVMYSRLDLFEQAATQYERAVELSELYFGDGHADTIRLVQSLGVNYSEAGEKIKALPLFQRVHDYVKTNASAGDEERLIAVNNLGVVLFELNRFNEALPLLRESYETKYSINGASNLGTLDSLLYLAQTYSHLGNSERSTELLQQAVSVTNRELGVEHRYAILSAQNLANNYLSLKRHAEALDIIEETLERSKRYLGELDLATLALKNNLALVNAENGDFDLAIEQFSTLIDDRRSAVGAEHYTVAETANNLASVYEELGRYDEAEREFRFAVEHSQRALGDNHPQTLVATSNLSKLMGKVGNFGEAERLARDTLERRRQVHGEQHPETLTSISNLAILLHDMGQLAEAFDFYERALGISNQIWGPDHSETMIVRHNIAAVFIEAGRFDEAKVQMERVFEANSKFHGNAHPRTLHSLHNLAFAQSMLGLFDQAESNFKTVISLRKKSFGRLHPSTLTSVNGLALLYSQRGKRSDADELYARLILDAESVLEPSNPNLGIYYANYAEHLALTSQERAVAIFFAKKSVDVVQAGRLELSDSGGDQEAFLSVRADVFDLLQKLLIDQGRFVEAEQVGRMLKEREFYDFVRRRSGGSDDPRKSRAELTKRETEWKAQLASWSDRPNRIAAELSALNSKKMRNSLLTSFEQRQLSDLQTEYEVAYSTYKSNVDTWLSSVRTLSDETIQAEARSLEARYHDSLQEEISELGEGVAALQIVAFEDGIHFFLITPDAFKHIENPISRSDLNEAIFAARAAMRPNESTGRLDNDPRLQLQALYRMLFEPLRQELEDAGAETIMLNLQGAIRYVPFAALHDGESYLVEHYKFALFTPAARTRFSPPGGYSTATGFGVSEGHSHFAALPGVVEELASIFGSETEPGILDGPTYLDPEFTRASFADELQNERPIVHIASHFHMRPGNDSNSFLLLGDGSYLTLAEINNSSSLRFRGVELLTLSACSTALSTQGDFDVNSGTGAEVEGFGVLAQRKGADAVIASLWDVDDESTAELMADLYTNLTINGTDKSEALRTAQRKQLQNPRTSHPYFWAPFILMGNWR